MVFISKISYRLLPISWMAQEINIPTRTGFRLWVKLSQRLPLYHPNPYTSLMDSRAEIRHSLVKLKIPLPD